MIIVLYYYLNNVMVPVCNFVHYFGSPLPSVPTPPSAKGDQDGVRASLGGVGPSYPLSDASRGRGRAGVTIRRPAGASFYGSDTTDCEHSIKDAPVALVCDELVTTTTTTRSASRAAGA